MERLFPDSFRHMLYCSVCQFAIQKVLLSNLKATVTCVTGLRTILTRGNIEEFQKDFAALDKGTVKVRVFSTSSISIVTNPNIRCTKNGLRKRRRLWKVHAAWYVTCTLLVYICD